MSTAVESFSSVSKSDCDFCEKHKQDFDTPPRPANGKYIGLIVGGIFGFTGLALVAIAFPFIKPAFRKYCLPYVPATDAQVSNVITALGKGRKHQTLIDLGSGDGRIVFAAADHGLKAVGVELNSWLVLYSKIKARLRRQQHLAKFERRDLWKINFADYDNVVIFGVDQMMRDLETKFNQDTTNSGKKINIIACRFPLANSRPLKSIGSGVDTVWLYEL